MATRDDHADRDLAAPSAALPHETRSVVLPPIRVSPSERRAYEAAAERDGVGLSEWIRSIAANAASRNPQVERRPSGPDVHARPAGADRRRDASTSEPVRLSAE